MWQIGIGFEKKIKGILKGNPVLERYTKAIISGYKIQYILHKTLLRRYKNIFNIAESAKLSNCTFDIIGRNNEIEIGELSLLNNVTFFIRGNNNKIKIGKKVSFDRSCTIWIEDFCCEAIIGENSTFQDAHIAVTEPNSKIHIGDDCMFAYDIDLRTGDSHSIIDSSTNDRINYAQNIFIGNHVWIASHVSILKGVIIPDNSIVATRSVVTKSFEGSNLLIGGIPAKQIKNNVNWDRKRIYR
ncbi:acyltransferase [Fibrella aquatilis]|uniref:Acyltransferase n=1 Tax=Fibrella aquatilis TaxID=2817059 RepID=A0A939G992_9BACT|nr:acyltransferase [Fibrella aquatilis]MBO0933568.1 acyltransferase [Fibrella aquatilis]